MKTTIILNVKQAHNKKWELSYRSILSSWSMKKTVKWSEWEEGNILNLLSSIVDDAEKDSPALLCGLILAQIAFLDITTWASDTCNVRVCVWGHEISEVRPQLCDGSNFAKVQQQRRPPKAELSPQRFAILSFSFLSLYTFDISHKKMRFHIFILSFSLKRCNIKDRILQKVRENKNFWSGRINRRNIHK